MPSWYRRVDKRMWGDAKFRALSRPGPSAQVLWIYLLTGDHTDGLPGLYAVGEAAMAEALGWPLESFRERFAELFANGMAKADWEARVVWIPNALRYNLPSNPNVLKRWCKILESIPECALKDEAVAQLKSFAKQLGKRYAEALREPIASGIANTNPNPKTNTKRGDTRAREASATASLRGSPDAVPPSFASPGDGEKTIAPPRPPESPRRNATRQQVEMLCQLASERQTTIQAACAAIGVVAPIAFDDVTKLKAHLRAMPVRPPRILPARGSTLPPDPPAADPTPEAIAAAEAAMAECKRKLGIRVETKVDSGQ